ncbi:hypothetical protein ACHQM5_022361 [Ranunculus cassubicifolius]
MTKNTNSAIKPATTTSPKRRKLDKHKSLENNNNKSSDSDDSTESKSEKIQKLLEPYSKEQLIDFLCDASLKDSTLLEKIRSIADQDVSHRKIFVHGIGWDTTQETFKAIFEPFGEIEECRLVVDKVTGRAKGYGFVLYKFRVDAVKALKEPQKKINNRFVACQLASIGPGMVQKEGDSTGRKIYVSNVGVEIDAEKLKVMFAEFGEIEMGPLGFDVHTGKSRGFALFLYKTVEGAKKALEQPYKMFEGHQLHCQLASKSSNNNQQQTQLPQSVQPSALAAAQNLAMFTQHPSLNPLYNGFLMNQNPGFLAGNVNPMFLGGFHPSQIGGSSVENSIGLGGYGSQGLLGAGGRSSLNPLQGMQPYESSQQQYLGQSSSSSRTQPLGGSFTGYPTYMW